MSRVLILGDIGAQIRVFENTLKAYVIDPDRPIIPDDTILVQVGDLVRRQIPGQALEDHHLNDEDNDKDEKETKSKENDKDKGKDEVKKDEKQKDKK